MESPVAVGVYAFASWVSLYLLISYLLRMWAKTSRLPEAYRAKIAESFVSGVQGAACGIIGICTVIYCKDDVMRVKYPLALNYCPIGNAYFIYDLWAMYRSHVAKRGNQASILSFIKSECLMIIHHITLVFVLFPIMAFYSSMGHFFLGSFFCAELSTPFVNGRVILSRLGLKRSKIYIVNGVLMVTIFAMCRVALVPIMYAVFLSQQTKVQSNVQALLNIPLTCHVSCLVVMAPQLYWFTLMLKGAMTVIYPNTKQDPKDKNRIHSHNSNRPPTPRNKSAQS